MHDLAPFIQLKKHEKHPWESVAFSKVTAGGASQGFMKAFIKYLEARHLEHAILQKVILLHGSISFFKIL